MESRLIGIWIKAGGSAWFRNKPAIARQRRTSRSSSLPWKPNSAKSVFEGRPFSRLTCEANRNRYGPATRKNAASVEIGSTLLCPLVVRMVAQVPFAISKHSTL